MRLLENMKITLKLYPIKKYKQSNGLIFFSCTNRKRPIHKTKIEIDQIEVTM